MSWCDRYKLLVLAGKLAHTTTTSMHTFDGRRQGREHKLIGQAHITAIQQSQHMTVSKTERERSVTYRAATTASLSAKATDRPKFNGGSPMALDE